MTLTQRSLVDFRPAALTPWLRALATRLLVSRPTDDTAAASYLSTRKWSDATERGLHSALERRPQQRHGW